MADFAVGDYKPRNVARLPLGHGGGDEGITAHPGPDGLNVVFEIQGITIRGQKPKLIGLGWDPDAAEAWLEQVREVIAECRAERENYHVCSGCKGLVRNGEESWPECAQDCAE